MGLMKEERQRHFIEWLAKFVSSAQLSEFYQALVDLEESLSSHRYPNHLPQSLIQTTDAAAIDSLYNVLRINKQFMHSHRPGLKLSLLRYYTRYCKEHPSESEEESRSEVSSMEDMPSAQLESDDISHADERTQSDAQEIPKSPQVDLPARESPDQGIPPAISEAKPQEQAQASAFKAQEIPESPQADLPARKSPDQGIPPAISEAKPQEQTQTSALKAIGYSEASDPDIVQLNQHAFSRWLREQAFGVADAFAIYGTAGKIHKALLAEGMCQGLLGIQEIDSIRACINAVKQKESFIQGDKAENSLWTQTLDCYLRFAESQKGSASTAQAVARPTEPVAAAVLSGAMRKPADAARPGHETSVDSLTSEAGFAQWLQKNQPNEPAKPCVKVIRDVEHFAQRKHMNGAKLMGIMPSAMRPTVSRLLASKVFAHNNAYLYRSFRRIAPWLIQYAETLSRAGKSDSDTKAASIARAAPALPQKEAREKKGTALEPALLSLLQGEQLSALRQALIEKGICSLADFQQLNLWVFMNQNRLYSIGQRQEIYSALRRAMAQGNASQSGAGWKITAPFGEYIGSSPAEALMEYCRSVALRYPLKFRNLIGRQMNGVGPVPLMQFCLHVEDLRMDNPEAYIDCEVSADTALAYAQWIGAMCRDLNRPRAIAPIDLARAKIAKTASAVKPTIKAGEKRSAAMKKESPPAPENLTKAPVSASLQAQVEQMVLSADLEGISLEQLCAQLPTASMAALRQIRDTSPRLVDMGDKLIHTGAFVDWETAAGKLAEILEKLLSKNNGYVSAAQLYEYARVELQMFLNDNDIADESSVYCIARHLFEKEGWHGIHYVFSSGSHISRGGDEALHTTLDVIRKFARDHNGFFSCDALVAYLEQVGIKTSNWRSTMHIGDKPDFFYYSGEEIISAENMQIDKAWLEQAEKALKRLFADVGDHVVLRSINPIWYEQLPSLPGHLPWTALLLQYILQFYGKQLGAKTISTELNQKYDVVHAMLVTQDSEIQTFADAVVAYLVDSEIPERHFDAEELRGKLVRGGLIAGNELIWHMPKAIGSDPRFAWDASGQKVSIKV